MTDQIDNRREAIALSIAEMCAELITANEIRDVENDAAESADNDSDKPPTAKLAISFQWAAGAQRAEVEAKMAWSVRRQKTADRVVDPAQIKMELVPMEWGLK